VKTTGIGGEQRGYDVGKKVCDRKRYLLVDTEGFVLKVNVHSAKVPDQDGLRVLLEAVMNLLRSRLLMRKPRDRQGTESTEESAS
jgi:hypothetical protein